MRPILALSLVLSLTACSSATQSTPKQATTGSKIQWLDWSEKRFQEAKKQNKLVLLDLGAVWCHWCHVMDEETYADPEVVAEVEAHWLPVKVDQDAHPDLASRYGDYGWPATILFDAQGTELAKFQGYVPKRRFLSLLKAFVEDPTPGPSARSQPPATSASTAVIAKDLKDDMLGLYEMAYDSKFKGWGTVQKWLDWDCVEYAMARARRGDKRSRSMAIETLESQIKLLDPVWGGVYQYSHGGVWTEPHYEKLTIFQAHNIRIYALAARSFQNDKYLKVARAILKYCDDFQTSPEGAYYTSQDADLVKGQHSKGYFLLDDKARRKQGLPAVDKQLYTRENGLMIHALCELYNSTGDASVLNRAKRAAAWLEKHRKRKQGGYTHGQSDRHGPYLRDNLCAAGAMLALAMSTGEESYLVKAQDCMRFVDKALRGPTGFVSFPTPKASVGVFKAAFPVREENIQLARVANQLYHNTGDKAFRGMAEHALKYLLSPKLARQQRTAATLLAALEFSEDCPHVTVYGPSLAKTDSLYQAVLRQSNGVLALERRTPSMTAKARFGINSGPKGRSVVLVCSGQRCSLPAATEQEITQRLTSFGYKPARIP